MDFDWSVVVESLPALLDGAKLTVLIALTGLLGGTVVGLLFGLMRAYSGSSGEARIKLPTSSWCEAHRSWCR